MKIGELRAGNWIIDPEQIEFDGLMPIAFNSTLDDIRFYELTKPASLNIKLLKKLKFRKNRDGIFCRRINKAHVSYSIDDKFLNVSFNDNDIRMFEIESLHQLQNAIWLGTGKDWDYCEMRDLIWYN